MVIVGAIAEVCGVQFEWQYKGFRVIAAVYCMPVVLLHAVIKLNCFFRVNVSMAELFGEEFLQDTWCVMFGCSFSKYPAILMTSKTRLLASM